jgi:hypothetical protein
MEQLVSKKQNHIAANCEHIRAQFAAIYISSQRVWFCWSNSSQKNKTTLAAKKTKSIYISAHYQEKGAGLFKKQEVAVGSGWVP